MNIQLCDIPSIHDLLALRTSSTIALHSYLKTTGIKTAELPPSKVSSKLATSNSPGWSQHRRWAHCDRHKVVKVVNSVLADVRSASDEIQSLQVRLNDVAMLLRDLEQRREQGFFQSTQDLAMLERSTRSIGSSIIKDVENHEGR